MNLIFYKMVLQDRLKLIIVFNIDRNIGICFLRVHYETSSAIMQLIQFLENFTTNKDVSNSQSPSPHKSNQRIRVHKGAIDRISETCEL